MTVHIGVFVYIYVEKTLDNEMKSESSERSLGKNMNTETGEF